MGKKKVFSNQSEAETKRHLAPTLFIIDVEVLSRGLNSLQYDPYHTGYGMPKWSLDVNYISCICRRHNFILF